VLKKIVEMSPSIEESNSCDERMREHPKDRGGDSAVTAAPATVVSQIPPSISVTSDNRSNDIPFGKQHSTSMTDLHRNLFTFELTRNLNTEWLMDTDARHKGKLTPLLITYISSILLGQIFNSILFPPHISWTVTNVVHGFITMLYLHWIKGSPNFCDVSGSGAMNGLTLWEQLYHPGYAAENNRRFSDSKLVLLVVPTILCYLGCAFSSYDRRCSVINVVVWVICIIAKMPFMHGVRILGINSTVGIDDHLTLAGLGDIVKSDTAKVKDE
jgi:hypothetical protein